MHGSTEVTQWWFNGACLHQSVMLEILEQFAFIFVMLEPAKRVADRIGRNVCTDFMVQRPKEI